MQGSLPRFGVRHRVGQLTRLIIHTAIHDFLLVVIVRENRWLLACRSLHPRQR
jgi:hypothetical protein